MGLSMMGYVNAVKRSFRDQHGFTPDGGTEDEPLFNSIPHGIYESVIDGKTDFVVITKNYGMSFLNATREEAETKYNK